MRMVIGIVLCVGYEKGSKMGRESGRQEAGGENRVPVGTLFREKSRSVIVLGQGDDVS